MTFIKSALRSIDRAWIDSHFCCQGNGAGDHHAECQYAQPAKQIAPPPETPFKKSNK